MHCENFKKSLPEATSNHLKGAVGTRSIYKTSIWTLAKSPPPARAITAAFHVAEHHTFSRRVGCVRSIFNALSSITK